jgi:hypothetical protein
LWTDLQPDFAYLFAINARLRASVCHPGGRCDLRIGQIADRKRRRILMEPRRAESATPETTPQQQQKRKGRFQILKLEERIAPSQGGIPAKTHACRYSKQVCTQP